jgi:hypothetical protein
MMLIPFAVAALVGLYLATKKKVPRGTPGNLLPTPENIPKVESSAKPVVPSDVITPYLRKSVVKLSANRDNRSYTVTVFNTKSRDKQFVLVQLNETSAWLGYYQIGATKPPTRKLTKSYAKGDRDQSGRVVSIMMSDWGVKK